MPLRATLSTVRETFQEVELAAAERFVEGQQLVASQQYSGGIYLMGCSAEMLLKGACALYSGANSGDMLLSACDTLLSKPFGAASFRQAINKVQPQEGKHSIAFWSMMLQAVRAYQGDQFSDGLSAELNWHTDRLHGNWLVEMRYRKNRATPREALDTIADVAWIRHSYALLFAR